MRGTVIALAIFALVGIGCGKTAPVTDLASTLSAAGPLLNSVSSAVPGLSQAQSALGVGSLLGLAKGRMPTNQYSQVSNALPGADALVAEATRQGLPSQLGGLADVSGFLGKSGISTSQVNQLIPALGNALTGKVNPDIASAFMSALR